ncbi:MAG: prepilin-type N-terminal cleavage/methylation domain-containing protein [Armatimonadetes bacterium]|nr:prepilin-type N-terminal cleavage/methylation domain-containing protein [Armatimonadota bacterium]
MSSRRFFRASRSDRRACQGLTLVEMMIVLTLLALLAAGLFTFLLGGKRIWQSSLTGSAGRESLQVAARDIALQLRDSSAGTLAISPTGAAFSFLSARDRSGRFVTTSTGTPTWQKYVVYYIPAGTTRLVRKEIYGSHTRAMTAGELAAATADGSGRTLAFAVTGMRLTANGPASVLALDWESRNQQGGIESQSLWTSIFIRNTGVQ